MKCSTESQLREQLVATRAVLKSALRQRDDAIKSEKLAIMRKEQYKADIKRLLDKIEFEEQCG